MTHAFIDDDDIAGLDAQRAAAGTVALVVLVVDGQHIVVAPVRDQFAGALTPDGGISRGADHGVGVEAPCGEGEFKIIPVRRRELQPGHAARDEVMQIGQSLPHRHVATRQALDALACLRHGECRSIRLKAGRFVGGRHAWFPMVPRHFPHAPFRIDGVR